MTPLIERLLASLGNFSIPSFSGVGPGWLFGAFGALAVSLFGLSIGRTKAVISLISLYVAFAFERLFPYWNNLNGLLGERVEIYWIRLGLFFIAYAFVFIIFNISFIKKRLSASEYSLFGVLILSLIQFGFLASIVFGILPQELALRWSFGFYNFFATSTALFFWAIAPLPIIMLIRK